MNRFEFSHSGRRIHTPAVVARRSGLAAFCALAAMAVSASAAAPATQPSRVTPVVTAYQRVRPVVVNISSEQMTAAGGLLGEDPLEDIFPNPFTRPTPVMNLGSGFIIHPAGYIVTNAHVVRRAEKITVTLDDKSRHDAQVIAADPRNDLAVLKIALPDKTTLPHQPLGRSDDLMVGETVIAIGNAMGFSNTVTVGVVSAVDRTLEFRGGVKYTGLIQTDAPINPGNSGGPLVNIHGQIIGINTAIRADAQSIGFAIPADTLSAELAKLLDFERIHRVIFGASVSQRHADNGDELTVDAVRPQTPAEGKLLPGDRLRSVNGQPMRQIADFACLMISLSAPATVTLQVERQGRLLDVEVPLAVKPKPDGNALARKWMGLSLRRVTPQLARDLRLPINQGLLVTSLDGGGAADQLGIRLKDVVFQMGPFYVKELDDVAQVLEDVQEGQAIRVGIIRGNVRAWAPLVVRPHAERPETKTGKTR